MARPSRPNKIDSDRRYRGLPTAGLRTRGCTHWMAGLGLSSALVGLLACDGGQVVDNSGQLLAQAGGAEIGALSVVANPAPRLDGRGGFVESSPGVVEFSLTVEDCPEGEHQVVVHGGRECGVDGSGAGEPWAVVPGASEIGRITCNADGTGRMTVRSQAWSLAPGADNNPGTQAVVVHGLDPEQRVACGVVDNDDHELRIEPMVLNANPAPELSGRMRLVSRADYSVDVELSLSGCPTGHHQISIFDGEGCGSENGALGKLWDPYERGPEAVRHRVGPEGSVVCDDNGQAKLSFSTQDWILVAGELDNPLGKLLVVHGIDPANRVACGPLVADRVQPSEQQGQ